MLGYCINVTRQCLGPMKYEFKIKNGLSQSRKGRKENLKTRA